MILGAEWRWERGESMWQSIKAGQTVLLELPSRWYLGTVAERDEYTLTLTEALCGHDLGDLGLFLAGEISEATELTPLLRGIEVALAAVESAQPYPPELLKRVRKRTHSPQGNKA